MKNFPLQKLDFPGAADASVLIPFSRESLFRGAAAVGRKIIKGPASDVVQGEIDMTIGAIRSALDMSGRTLKATSEYLASGKTLKAKKSFFVGNALCAHSSLNLLGVPWLVDIEALPMGITIFKKEGNQSPDFLGRSPDGRWFVFESKGRTKKPAKADLTECKAQAAMVEKVNGIAVTQNIVSVSYVTTDGDVEMIWADPPSEGLALHFDDATFFRAYYESIIHRMEQDNADFVEVKNGSAFKVPGEEIYIGLHDTAKKSYYLDDWNPVIDFARRNLSRREKRQSDGSILFPDGIIVKIRNDGYNNGFISSARIIRSSDNNPRLDHNVTMTTIGKSENTTQQRVIQLFVNELGYQYLGNWKDRSGNSNIEEDLLRKNLASRGYSADQISRALEILKRSAETKGRSLYHTNLDVYGRLRYGVPTKVEAGKVTETVHVIDWKNPGTNQFAIAEEVTLKGGYERRPDLVIYVNGIALAVLELKNSRVSIGDGIRQLISNQKPEFNQAFFSTTQLLIAGNDTAGLQYGTIDTPEKNFLTWKEDEENNEDYKLDKYLQKILSKERLLELIHDCVLFDGGVKKIPRVHQYFGLKAAQHHIQRGEGGIIWHTQGAGKSILMVLLAKWILENKATARVVVITDRDELDKQIESVFTAAGETISRTSSGRDLMKQLGQAKPRLLCSLVHKFGQRKVDDFEAFIRELESRPSKTIGDVFVFVDECHRSQSGKLHRAMKALMPNAVFIGFTGTPLLKKDRQTTIEIFGHYIHTYKFAEAVEDRVVLDLIYEARDIDQELGSTEKIDAWFEAKTKGLNDWQKDELKTKWGTMQKVLSSHSRMQRVVNDILFDFSVRPRLSSERGNAILVASSIHDACRYFTLFGKTPLKNRCAVITSYNPNASDISTEDTGEDSETDKEVIFKTYTALLESVTAAPGKSKTETYEDEAKKRFIKEPAKMKLLIVVDKLLTGFDAPACTYLYIDKSMQDHGLFQAICRTNRLDGEDKDFGYIVDYKDLFKKVEKAISVYSAELDRPDGEDPQILLKDRLETGRERLDDAIEKLHLLCEPVEEPKGELQHIHYFCGNSEIPTDLEERHPQREALYKSVVHLIRSYANIADELASAGYSPADIKRIEALLEHYRKLRDTIRQASGETLDLKPYEADMRHLIDTYIEAKEPKKISPFDDRSLLDIIVKTGIAEAITAKLDAVGNHNDSVAEAIENNVRKKIVTEHLNDPAFFAKMSLLLDEIIRQRKQKAWDYQKYLQEIANLVKQMDKGHFAGEKLPESVKHSPALRALFHNLLEGTETAEAGQVEESMAIYDRAGLAIRIDEVVRKVKPADFRGNKAKENEIKKAIFPLLGQNLERVEKIFAIIEQQAEY